MRDIDLARLRGDEELIEEYLSKVLPNLVIKDARLDRRITYYSLKNYDVRVISNCGASQDHIDHGIILDIKLVLICLVLDGIVDGIEFSAWAGGEDLLDMDREDMISWIKNEADEIFRGLWSMDINELYREWKSEI